MTDPRAKGQRIVLAYNPASGSYCGQSLDRLHRALENAGHHVVRKNSRDDDLAQGADIICAFGGDGTVRTVVHGEREGEQQDGTAHCIFPAGTINLIAREAGYPHAPEAFARRVSLAAAPRRHYFGTINGETFLCCASVGPDAQAVARVSDRLKRRIGRMAYAVAALGQLWRWPRQNFTFTVDGAEYAGQAMFVCKGRYYAGPWVIDPAADLTRPELRVVILPRAGRLDILRLALSAIVHPALGGRDWHRLSAREIAIASDAPAPIQADGDVIAHVPATITLAGSFLNFL